jgi:hypothetical protein
VVRGGALCVLRFWRENPFWGFDPLPVIAAPPKVDTIRGMKCSIFDQICGQLPSTVPEI